jgi:hypothetical protein
VNPERGEIYPAWRLKVFLTRTAGEKEITTFNPEPWGGLKSTGVVHVALSQCDFFAY